MHTINEGNGFNIIVVGQERTGGTVANIDLSTIDDMMVYLVKAGRGRKAMAYAVNDEGEAVLSVDAGMVSKGIYGIEVTGSIDGVAVHAQQPSAFMVVDGYAQHGDMGGVIDYEVHLVMVVNAAASRRYVEEAVAAEAEARQAADDALYDAIGRAGKVDDVLIDGESILDPETKEANIDSSQFGKVDDVKVNGISVLDSQTKEANIEITASVVDNDTPGDPTATATMEDGNINIEFEHVKGTKGDKGEKGDQGDSFQPIEDVSGLVLAHTLGQDNTKAMSQKGVTNEISPIKEKINGKNTALSAGTDYNVTSGGYIYKDGHIASLNAGRYTSPISVKAGDTITYSCDGSTTGNMATLSKVIIDDASYEPLVVDANGYAERTYQVQEDMQIAFSWTTSGEHNSLDAIITNIGIEESVEDLRAKLGNTDELVSEMQESLTGTSTSLNPNENYTIVSGKYLNKSGRIATLAKGRYTSPIDVHAGEVIVYTCDGSDTGNIASLSKVITDGESYEPLVVDGDGYVERTYQVEEDMQVAFSWTVSNGHNGATISIQKYGLSKEVERVGQVVKSLSAEVEKMSNDPVNGMPVGTDNPLARTITGASRARIFASYGIIGASFETSLTNRTGLSSVYDQGYEWPTMFGNINGVTVFNHSIAGNSLANWLSKINDQTLVEHFDGQCLPWSDYANSPAECYIINMSSNELDPNKFNGVPGDADELDLSHNYYEDDGIESMPYTEVLAAVIQLCRVRSPKCFIFLATMRKINVNPNYNDPEALCEAMKAVAEKFDDCFVLDMHTYGFDWPNYATAYGYMSSQTGNHPTRLGHIHLADEFNTYIDWVVGKYPTAFPKVSFILEHDETSFTA